MNDMFDELKSLKSQLQKSEEKQISKKPSKTKEQIIEEKEAKMQEEFLAYMKDIKVKKS